MVQGQPGWAMTLAVFVKSASTGREFSNSDKTQGSVHGPTSYKSMEAAVPGEKIVKWGGLEDLTLAFFSESSFQWGFSLCWMESSQVGAKFK